jgi:hypothetical protein
MRVSAPTDGRAFTFFSLRRGLFPGVWCAAYSESE